jgi:hypothetical protein
MRPNRAAVTPIGQQNPTRTPKTVGFAREKKAKIPIFDFAKKDRFFRCTFCVLVRGPVQLDFTVGGLKPISEGHSLILLLLGPVQIFVWRGPIQIAENR